MFLRKPYQPVKICELCTKYPVFTDFTLHRSVQQHTYESKVRLRVQVLCRAHLWRMVCSFLGNSTAFWESNLKGCIIHLSLHTFSVLQMLLPLTSLAVQPALISCHACQCSQTLALHWAPSPVLCSCLIWH